MSALIDCRVAGFVLAMSSATSEATAIYAHRCPDLRAKLPFLNSAQVARLEEFFGQDKNPAIGDVIIMAAELGLPVQAVRVRLLAVSQEDFPSQDDVRSSLLFPCR